MNIKIILNGSDVTGSCLLSATRIAFDSTKRITTASISIMGQALNAAMARYDSAIYDTDVYSIGIKELYEVAILDGRDGVTKLFDGQIYAITMQQSDTPGFSLFYQCDMNDWAAWLDRAVCWDSSFALTLPNSDQGIITALLGKFCPKIQLADIANLVPQINAFDWLTKTCRQVLDELTTLSMGQWRVDFNGGLHYSLASAAPAAPFGLSTSPDYVSTFPVRVEGYKHDFTNPINHMYVRGGPDQSSGVVISASYSDPVSIGQYGEYSSGIVDTSIVTGWDAALKAKSQVLTYGYPIETGSFIIWGPDGLECGMQVHIKEERIGIEGDYTIRALAMQWVDPELVMYTAQFGAAQPDLETILRLLNQRTLWQTSNKGSSVPGPPSPPPPGSVTDASIASGGLSAGVINSINASTIQGQISSGQIGSVNATTIIGQVQAGQIATVNASSIVGSIDSSNITTVNASSIQGLIQSGQIGTVNATSIQGVVLSSQLADGIIDTLSKYATALTPIQMVKTGDPWPPAMPNKNFPPNSFFYYQPNGHFYQMSANGLTWTMNDNPQGSLMSFFFIGAINASSITGLIVAAQIGSITAGQITGAIQSNQIGSVSVSTLVGQLTASQIASVNANAIQGTISATQIGSIPATQISGLISAGQIDKINASQISGTIQSNQINTITAGQVTGTFQGSQIANINATTINSGTLSVGGTAQASGVNVYNGTTLIGQIGSLSSVGGTFGGWFQVFGAGGGSYSNAPIYTDSAGNLHIRNADMTGANLANATLTGATMNNSALNINGQILTGPQQFDATYGSLAIQNKQEPDTASFVSRGLVLYYNDAVIGSFVRNPGGGYASLELLGNGGYILAIGGSAGYIRSDGGYRVTSQIGRTVTYTVALAGGGSVTLNFAGGILVP
jgi:hypothetical protein